MTLPWRLLIKSKPSRVTLHQKVSCTVSGSLSVAHYLTLSVAHCLTDFLAHYLTLSHILSRSRSHTHPRSLSHRVSCSLCRVAGEVSHLASLLESAHGASCKYTPRGRSNKCLSCDKSMASMAGWQRGPIGDSTRGIASGSSPEWRPGTAPMHAG